MTILFISMEIFVPNLPNTKYSLEKYKALMNLVKGIFWGFILCRKKDKNLQKNKEAIKKFKPKKLRNLKDTHLTAQ